MEAREAAEKANAAETAVATNKANTLADAPRKETSSMTALTATIPPHLSHLPLRTAPNKLPEQKRTNDATTTIDGTAKTAMAVAKRRKLPLQRKPKHK